MTCPGQNCCKALRTNIYLIGMPGSGKTTVGQQLAIALKKPFFDLDHLIEENEQEKIADIFNQQGEDYFRDIEKNMLEKIIANNNNIVLSTGGGTPCFHSNLTSMLKSGVVVYLKYPVPVLIKRLAGNTERPLLTGDFEKKMQDLYKKRKPVYEQAHIIFESTDLEELITRLKEKSH